MFHKTDKHTISFVALCKINYLAGCFIRPCNVAASSGALIRNDVRPWPQFSFRCLTFSRRATGSWFITINKFNNITSVLGAVGYRLKRRHLSNVNYVRVHEGLWHVPFRERQQSCLHSAPLSQSHCVFLLHSSLCRSPSAFHRRKHLRSNAYLSTLSSC